ncbi:MAG: MASE1 domain-containing protein [Betaproteobacteria bacterium]|nr:MASE1 domain-containing protein [Betaproteobacteria bacterium]
MTRPSIPPPPPASSALPREPLLLAVMLAAGYLLLAWFGITLHGRSGFSSYIWPAAGFALGILLRAPKRHWPLLAGAIYGASVTSGLAAGYALLPTLLNGVSTLMVLANALALHGALRGRLELDRMGRLFRFVIVTGATTLAVSALGGLYSLLLFDKPFLQEWRTWFIADWLGIVLLAPFTLAWTRPDRERLADRVGSRKVEVTLLYIGLIGTTLAVYTSPVDPYSGATVPTYLCIPFLVWAALRFGLRGTTLGLVTFAILTLWYTARGLGPFAPLGMSVEDAALRAQLYLAAIAIMVMFGGALMFERERALSENQSWRRRYEAAIAASRNLVFEINPETGTILWAGDTAGLLGITRSSIETVRGWNARVHDADRQRLLGLRAKLAAGELASVLLEYRVRRDDNVFIHIEVDAYSIAGEDADEAGAPRRIIGFIKDITDAKREAEERAAAEDRARQSQKMEAIGRLAGGIAHDFNNILGAILGYGEMARGKVPVDSDVRRHLDTIVAAGERGKALVAQILAFSRAKPSEKQPVLMGPLIDEVTALLHGSLPARIRLVTRVNDSDLTVQGDVTQLHQLVMNLATNAVQSMPGEGELVIAVQMTEVAEPWPVRLGALHRGHYAVVTVKDTGVGMDAATLDRAFEPFFTTKPLGKGTGLGLALAHNIALAHDGAVDVQSSIDAKDHGTTFTMYLPAEDAASAPPVTHEDALPHGAGQTVLIVDDETPLVRLMEDQLAALGYEPVGFTRSQDALAAIEAAPTRFDAIISDEVMPGMTGTDLTARLRAAGLRLPVLLVSGYGGPGFEIRAQAAGVTMLLKKPCSEHELAEALAELLPAR